MYELLAGIERDKKLHERRNARRAPPVGHLYLDTVYEQLAHAAGSSKDCGLTQADVFQAVRAGSLKVRDVRKGVRLKDPSGLVETSDYTVAIAAVNAWLADIDAGADFRLPESQDKPVSNEAKVTQVRSGDAISTVIAKARKAVEDPSDVAQVWTELQRLARLSDKDEEKRPEPLTGRITSGGLQYFNGGTAAVFTRKALGARLKREADKKAREKPAKAR